MDQQPVSPFKEYVAARGAALAENHLRMVSAALILGVPVFPCGVNKQPLTRNGHKDASDDPAAIEAMGWGGAALIGMPTGAASGLVVIDVDVHGAVDGTPWLTANAARLPITQKNRTRSGGVHLVFLAPTVEIRNSASRIAPGVDVRGNGGYIIVPPSDGYSVADASQPAAMPAWLVQACLPAPADPLARPEPSPVAPRAHHANVHAETWSVARVDGLLRGSLDALRNAPDGAKHATLVDKAVWIGGIMDQIGLGEEDAVRRLIGALPGTVRDWKAAEKTARWGITQGRARPVALEEERAPPPEEVHPAAEWLAHIRAPYVQRIAKPLPVAAQLMDVGGVLQDFLDHCRATAVSPQPFLDLAAGICMIGALAGRQYRTRTDLRTNVYAAGIADSGGGKDHARKRIKACLAAAGLGKYMAGEDIASGSAIMTALHRHPIALFQIDEFGDWLAAVLGKNAPAHKKQISEKLKSLYSSASTIMLGVEYANQGRDGRPREDIHQPHACFYGTTTPIQFWSAVGSSSMNDGLLARLLVFVSPLDYPDEAKPDLAEPSERLIIGLKAIAAGADGHDNGGNLGALMSAATAPAPYTVPESPAAEAAIAKMRSEQTASLRKAGGTSSTSVLARMAENAVKLALVRAVSRNSANPTIEAADVAWGAALARHCIATLEAGFDRHGADNEYEQKMNKGREIVRKRGPISERDMIRAGFKYPERDRAEILRTLVDSGMVIATTKKHSGAGRPVIMYSSSETLPNGWDSVPNDTIIGGATIIDDNSLEDNS